MLHGLARVSLDRQGAVGEHPHGFLVHEVKRGLEFIVVGIDQTRRGADGVKDVHFGGNFVLLLDILTRIVHGGQQPARWGACFVFCKYEYHGIYPRFSLQRGRFQKQIRFDPTHSLSVDVFAFLKLRVVRRLLERRRRHEFCHANRAYARGTAQGRHVEQ